MKNFLKHFKNKWYMYVLITTIILVSNIYAYSFKTETPSDEKLGIFIGSYGLKEGFVDTVSFEDDKIELNIYDENVNGDYYSLLFQSYIESDKIDLVIMPIDIKYQVSNIQYFIDLDNDLINSYFPGNDLYVIEEHTFGIKIYDKNTKTGYLKDYIDYEKENNPSSDYYLFFYKYSLHCGEFNNQKSSLAIEIVSEWFKSY